jgi:hypothetical protein
MTFVPGRPGGVGARIEPKVKYPPTMGLPAASQGRRAAGHAVRRRGWNPSSMAALAVALVAVIMVGAFVVAQLNRRPAGPAQGGVIATGATGSVSDQLSPFPLNCRGGTSLARGPAPALAYIDAVAVTESVGYDRLVIEFSGAAPALTDLITQDGATFPVGSGGTVGLSGRAGALLTLHGTDGHTRYQGQADLKAGSPVVVEVRKIQDAAGTVEWAVGLSRRGCYRMAFMDKPTRLVIDFQAGAGPT